MEKLTRGSAICLTATWLALAVTFVRVEAADGPKSGAQKREKPVNPLAETPTLPSKGTRADATSPPATPKGWVRHFLVVEPATGFQYRFESKAGNRRGLRLERGALEKRTGGGQAEVLAFRAGAYDDTKQGGFFTSPDSIPLLAQAIILIEGATSGDFLVCRSFGSWQGLEVTVNLYREEPDGSGTLLLTETIKDADEHKFPLP